MKRLYLVHPSMWYKKNTFRLRCGSSYCVAEDEETAYRTVVDDLIKIDKDIRIDRQYTTVEEVAHERDSDSLSCYLYVAADKKMEAENG